MPKPIESEPGTGAVNKNLVPEFVEPPAVEEEDADVLVIDVSEEN